LLLHRTPRSHGRLSTAATGLVVGLGIGWCGQEFPPAVLAAEVESPAVTFGVMSRVAVSTVMPQSGSFFLVLDGLNIVVVSDLF